MCWLLRNREGNEFSFPEDLGNSIREVYNRSMVLLSAFVPLYIGLEVTAPARADF